MTSSNSAIVQEFLIESFDNLNAIAEELTQYEKEGQNAELLNAIYRKVHTLKGSASFLGMVKLQEITHSGENILDYLRDGRLVIDPEIIDVLLESFDVSIELLKSIEETGKENDKDYTEINTKLVGALEKRMIKGETLLGSTTSLTDGNKGVIKKPTENPVYHEVSSSAPVQPQAAAPVQPQAAAPAPVVKPVAPVNVQPIRGVPMSMDDKKDNSDSEGGDKPSQAGGLKDSVVRVNVQLLDKIMNVVGELVLNRNQILQYANALDSGELTRLAQQLNVITTELQTDIMTTRMQPVGSVLTKFERIVRDLSRAQEKNINLEISGKDTELDKTLLEAIRDPLTHLIRNAVDHGIEKPDARSAKGKSQDGNIKIRAFHEGGQVTIEISDDGNGIDPIRVSKKAIQKGLYTEGQVADMSEKQILNMIFLPGFSTAEQVTNISGRGVGMDVVKSNIDKIGGSVDIFSKLGEGTIFKLKIPLTLAIVPALVVESSGETFAIPQINLVELVRLEGKEVDENIEDIHDSEFFRLRGDLIPIFRLNSCLALEKINHDINSAFNKDIESSKNNSISKKEHVVAEAHVEEKSFDDDNLKRFYSKIERVKKQEQRQVEKSDSVNIAILNADGRVYGLIVDQISDTEEIVVKPLSRKLKGISAFAGATIMGDGRVSLILDALGFFNTVDKGQKSKSEREKVKREDKIQHGSRENQEILLTILGDERPYGIPLVLVNRLEEFDIEDVEWSGNQPLIRYGDGPMPLVNLESTLKLNGSSILDKIKDKTSTVIPCVVVKIRGHFYGLVVHEIHDIAISEELINSATIDREGILGTIFVNGKTVTLIDVHSSLEMQRIGDNVIKGKRKIVKPTRGKILVVDDSPLYRKIETEFLQENGFEVIESDSGKEALEILRTEGDTIIMVMTDVEMPNFNGFELAEKIRSNKNSFSKIPILALSNKMNERDLEKGMRAGFNAHEEKFNREGVLKAINEFVSPEG